MTGNDKPLDEASYEAIEAAVMESERGRWFLNEFARRNRNSDTLSVLKAIERMQGAMPVRAPRLVYLESELADLLALVRAEQAAIAATRRDDPSLPAATDEASDPALRTALAAVDGMAVATEQIQDLAWALRERGSDEGLCAALDKHAGDLHTLGMLQEVTVRRLGQALALLGQLEQRLQGLSAKEAPTRAASGRSDVVVNLPAGADNGLRRRRNDVPATERAKEDKAGPQIAPPAAAPAPAAPTPQAPPPGEPPVASATPAATPSPAATTLRRYAGNVVFVDPGNGRRSAPAQQLPPEPEPVRQPASDARRDSEARREEPAFEPSVLAAFDALSWQEKLRRFT